MYRTDELLSVMGALGAAEAGQYVVQVTYDPQIDAWAPRGYGDAPLKASRAEAQISAWADLYPDDRYVPVPLHELKFYDYDEDERFGSGKLDQITLDEVAYRNAKAKQNAARRLASEQYTGTVEVSWADFLEQPDTPWLLHDLIAERSLNFLVARQNTGKSFAYLDMVLCMATGRDWHGVPTAPAKVMLVIGEGFSRFHKRVKAWCAQYDVDPLTLADNFVTFDGANLNNSESLRILSERVASFQPDLIVYDTWAQTSGISDENEAALASLTLNSAREIAPDAALLFVAHPTKSSEDTTHPILRGSGALAGAADCIMTMFVDSGYTTGLDRKYLAISTESEHGGKSRDAEQQTLRGFYLESVDPSAVLLRDDAAALTKADLFAFDWLEPGEVVTAQEVVERSGATLRTVQRHLKAAKAVVQTKGKGSMPDTYTLTAERKTTRIVNVTDEAIRWGTN